MRRLRAGWLAWSAAIALAAVTVACDPGQQNTTAADPASRAAAEGVAPMPAVGSVVDGSTRSLDDSAGPLSALVPPPAGQEQLVGVIAEHLPAGGYTYLWIEPEHGEARWVVTMRRDVETGDRVRVDSLGSRHDFYSRRLDRRFTELVFGVIEKIG